jgi:chromosome segregation ATPase
MVVFPKKVCYNQKSYQNSPNSGGFPMSSAYNFRSAFNGFNREDVVHYIEYANSNHNNQLNQLKSEVATLRQENADLRTAQQDKERITELEAQLDALRAELADVTAQRDVALATRVQVQSNTSDELEAYRRAERMERMAKERTDAMYQKATGILADAASKVDGATDQIAGIADQVAAQLAILQEAVLGSKNALHEATATLYALRPEAE